MNSAREDLRRLIGSPALAHRRSAARPARDYALRRILAAADSLSILLGLSVALVVGGSAHWSLAFAWAVLLLPGWILVFKLYGLYDRDVKRISHSTIDDVPWLFHALISGSVAGWLLRRFVPDLRIGFAGAIAFVLSTLVFVCLARAAARALASRRLPAERVLFVGGGPMASLLVRKIQAHPEYALEPIGYVDGEADASSLEGAIPYLGSLEAAGTICRQAHIDRVVIASPSVDDSTLADIVRMAVGLDLRMSILPHLSDVLGPSVAVDDVEGITILGLNPPALNPSSRLLKRTMDLTIASAVLAVVFPLMCLAALGILLSSRGPVFYSQERIGCKGKRFRIYKFRTMIVDADERVHELRHLSAHPVWLRLEHDPRITPLGRLLRRTSIDELPQLWNVLRGEMSMVGPRPMPPDVYEHINGWGRRRLDLTPGITGLWQVLGRANIPFEEMVKLDYLYVTSWSLWQDVRLLIQTLPAVVSQRGVN